MEILKIHKLSFGYGDNKLFDKASLTVYENEIVALTGRNGSGKSTLLKIIFGLIPIVKIQSNLFNKDETILISQDFPLHPYLNLKDNYQLIDNLFPFKIKNRLYNLDEYYNTKFKNLSSGNKTKALLNAYLGFPHSFKLFDEPTEFLDENAREKFITGYKQYFNTAIIATHDRDLINAVCTHEILITDQQFTKTALN